jgi:hypothetical protein
VDVVQRITYPGIETWASSRTSLRFLIFGERLSGQVWELDLEGNGRTGTSILDIPIFYEKFISIYAMILSMPEVFGTNIKVGKASGMPANVLTMSTINCQQQTSVIGNETE